MSFLARIIRSIEFSPTSVGLFSVAFVSLIVSRLLVESWLFGFPVRSGTFLFYEWSHNFSFFLVAFLLFIPLLRFFARISFRTASSIMLFGFLIILTPPVIDFVVSDGRGVWSFYIFDGFPGLLKRYFTFFGDRPDMGITYGVRVEVALVTIFVSWYVFLKTRRLFRALGAGIASYTLLFFLGTFPSWMAIIMHGVVSGSGSIQASDVAGIFLSPFSFFSRGAIDPRSILNAKMSLVYSLLLLPLFAALVFRWDKKVFFALFRNARFPQMLYHGGLLGMGMGLAFFFTRPVEVFDFFDFLGAASLLSATLFAWYASVVVNDTFDEAIDQKTNSFRPLPSRAIEPVLYRTIGALFFAASLFLSALVSVSSALFLFAYQALAWAYSAPPFRLKRFPVVASLLSAVASLLVLFAGYTLISSDGSIRTLPTSIVFLFLFAYTASIPLKDFKDIEGDRSDSVWTLPVLLGPDRAKLFIASGMFVSFLASVFVFRAPQLFLLALLFGGWSFWGVLSMRDAKVVAGKRKTGRITYRSVLWWILGIVFLYGLFAAGMVV